MDSHLVSTVVELAWKHGLRVDPASLRFNEAGLDYRIAFGKTNDGGDWVLRLPRRPDVAAKIEAEARILKLLAPELPARLPDWQICTSELIAYPLLPGHPGLTLDGETGAPIFHYDPTSANYAVSLGRFIAALHRIEPEQAQRAGLSVRTPTQVRDEWRSNIARVTAEFEVAKPLLERWQRWLEEDSYWPAYTTLTHGELYPAHVLIDDDALVCAVLDWTTAKVDDPALDFTFQQMLAGPSFDVTVKAYEEAGGRSHPRLRERCAELLAASPIVYGVFALTTGQPEHRAAAAVQLNPSE
jgi:macrolide phosphotransferase